MKTLVIVNPNARGGRVESLYRELQPRLSEFLGTYEAVITQNAEKVGPILDSSLMESVGHVLAMGGDGTNHSVINALVARPNLDVTFGSIPVGTGRDWARMLGTPKHPVDALKWLNDTVPVYCDVGEVKFQDRMVGNVPVSRLFLNIASAGISGQVDARVNRTKRRSKVTFVFATLMTILRYRPKPVTVTCDGEEFYSGKTYLLVVANGRAFGRGMWIAPEARIDDGKFDFLIVEGISRVRAVRSFPALFRGKHVEHPFVHRTRASTVHVRTHRDTLAMDLDGEEMYGQNLLFSILPRALRVRINPATAALIQKNPGQGGEV